MVERSRLRTELSLSEELRTLQSGGLMCDTRLVTDSGHSVRVHWPLLSWRGVWWSELGQHRSHAETVVILAGVDQHQLNNFVENLYYSDTKYGDDVWEYNFEDQSGYVSETYEEDNVEVKPEPEMNYDDKEIKTISFKRESLDESDESDDESDEDYKEDRKTTVISVGSEDSLVGFEHKDIIIKMLKNNDREGHVNMIYSRHKSRVPPFIEIDKDILGDLVDTLELKHLKNNPYRKYDFSCKICGKSNKHYVKIYSHVVSHVGKFIHCTECNKSCKWPEPHLKTRHSDHQSPRYTCEICDKEVIGKASLERHKATHIMMYCDMCDFHCEGQSNMYVHKDRKHFKRWKKEVVCPTCGKVLGSKDYLKDHMKIHEKDRQPLQCEFCDRTYITEHSLLNHQRAQHFEKKFVCDVCGQKFYTEFKQKAHYLRYHTDLKPFQCTECDYKTNNKRALEAHRSNHKPPKYSCPFCGKKFIQKQSMDKHIMTHTGEKPYGCKDCDFRCIQANDLRLHYSRRHGVKVENISQFKTPKPHCNEVGDKINKKMIVQCDDSV